VVLQTGCLVGDISFDTQPFNYRFFSVLAHARLSDQFFDKNIFNVAGGIELAFMSTTTDKDVAMSYMRGKTGAIFEIQMGTIDKGADLSQLSQYPGESEILFTPLTGKQQRSTIYRF
jgi:hypothetical protein